jgi:hypothetical protein
MAGVAAARDDTGQCGSGLSDRGNAEAGLLAVRAPLLDPAALPVAEQRGFADAATAVDAKEKCYSQVPVGFCSPRQATRPFSVWRGADLPPLPAP